MTNLPNLSKWHHYLHRSPASIEATEYPGLVADFYIKTIKGVDWTCGVYKHKDKPVLMAWGIKSNAHCLSHSLWLKGRWSAPIVGCPEHTTFNQAGRYELVFDGGKKTVELGRS